MDDQTTQQIPVNSEIAEGVPTQTTQMTQPMPNAPHRKRWPIVMAIVVAVVLIAGGGGLLIYRNAQQTALANCRSAMTEFSTARKNLLDTTNNASESEQLVRRLLGVDKVMDAFADAMDAAEGTLTDKACAANAMPTQLNIATDTIRSATDSLNTSVDKINAEIKSHAGDDLEALLNSLSPGTANSASPNSNAQPDPESQSGTTPNGNDGHALDDARQDLEDSLNAARALLNQLSGSLVSSGTGQLVKDTLTASIDAAQKLIDNSGITDTKLFKAANVTLDEAVTAVQNWIDSQAAKAK